MANPVGFFFCSLGSVVPKTRATARQVNCGSPNTDISLVATNAPHDTQSEDARLNTRTPRRLAPAMTLALIAATLSLTPWPALGGEHGGAPAQEHAPAPTIAPASEESAAKQQAVSWNDGKPQSKPEVLIKPAAKMEPKAEIKPEAKPALASMTKAGESEKDAKSPAVAAEEHAKPAPVVDPLSRLIEGNKRFVAMNLTHPDQTATQRLRLSASQKPFAIVLGCSDSRVPPELVFDQGLGDLFVIRVAGNVVDPIVLASIEYAAGHLGSPLIVVLGHERCGAVHATAVGDEPHGHLGSLVELLQPAVTEAKSLTGDVVENAVRINVKRMVTSLRTSKPVLAELVEAGKLKIVGARYDLDTGEVEIMP